MKRAFAALAALLVLALYLVAAWSSVDVLLAEDAATRRADWTPPSTPWHWQLARPGTVVWPGSTGFEHLDRGALLLSGTIPDGNADLSLDLRGEAIDLEVVDGALLRMSAKVPVRASLRAGPGAGDEIAAGTYAPESGGIRLVRDMTSELSRTDVLRLHLEAAPGTLVTLFSVDWLARAGVRPEPCANPASCAAPVPVLQAPGFLFPESMLAWRDEVMHARPAAIVEPARAGARVFAADVRAALRGEWAWLLAFAPVFVGVLSRWRTREATRGIALLELALVFAPWLLLQWVGWTDDHAPGHVTWVLVGSLVGALLLRPMSPTGIVGDSAAWRAAAKFLAGALAVIALLALANAFDADGFAARPVSATKAWQYPLWALVQQAILLRAIAPRMRLVTGSDGYGALFAGALFGALHLPNFALMVATFAAGTAWAAIGRRHPALLPLATVHAVSGIALVWAAPTWLLRSAEIGGRYLMAP